MLLEVIAAQNSHLIGAFYFSMLETNVTTLPLIIAIHMRARDREHMRAHTHITTTVQIQ